MWPELVQQTEKTVRRGDVLPYRYWQTINQNGGKKMLSLANVNRTWTNDPQLSQREVLWVGFVLFCFVFHSSDQTWSYVISRNRIRRKGIDRQSFFRQTYCRVSSLCLHTLTLKTITFSVSITGTGKVIVSLGAVIMSDGPLIPSLFATSLLYLFPHVPVLSFCFK